MIEFDSNYLLVNHFVCGKVYYFINPKFKNNKEPHYHIIAGKTKYSLIFVCCTTKWEKRLRWIQQMKHPLNTLVHIPESTNGLKKDSHVDCNFTFEIGVEQFKQMYSSNNVDTKGIIEENYFESIKKGIGLSYIVEQSTQILISKSIYNT